MLATLFRSRSSDQWCRDYFFHPRLPVSFSSLRSLGCSSRQAPLDTPLCPTLSPVPLSSRSAEGAMPAPTTAAKHLTVRGMDLICKTVRKDGASPLGACRAVVRGRERRGENPIHKSSIYLYLAGDTHRRGAKEKRGRKRLLSAADATRLDQTPSCPHRIAV